MVAGGMGGGTSSRTLAHLLHRVSSRHAWTLQPTQRSLQPQTHASCTSHAAHAAPREPAWGGQAHACMHAKHAAAGSPEHAVPHPSPVSHQRAVQREAVQAPQLDCAHPPPPTTNSITTHAATRSAVKELLLWHVAWLTHPLLPWLMQPPQPRHHASCIMCT